MAINKNQLMAVLRKNPVGVSCAGLCLCLALFAFYRSDAVSEVEESLHLAHSTCEKLNRNLTNSAHLKDDLELLQAASQKLQGRLIKASALADNQRYFYKLESATGVKLIDLKQASGGSQELAPKSKFHRVGFTVVVQGDYARLLTFLDEVERGGILSRINSMTLAPSVNVLADGPTEVSQLTMSLNLDLVGTP